jgi:hypothetical protein
VEFALATLKIALNGWNPRFLLFFISGILVLPSVDSTAAAGLDLLICGSVLKKWPLETQVAQIMNLLSLHFAGLAAGLRMSQGGATVQKRRDRSEALGDCRGTKETGMLGREFVTSGSAIFPSGYLAVFAAGTVLLR